MGTSLALLFSRVLGGAIGAPLGGRDALYADWVRVRVVAIWRARSAVAVSRRAASWKRRRAARASRETLWVRKTVTISSTRWRTAARLPSFRSGMTRSRVARAAS